MFKQQGTEGEGFGGTSEEQRRRLLAAMVGDGPADALWQEFGSLTAIGRATSEALQSAAAGLDAAGLKRLRAAFALAAQLTQETLPDPCLIQRPQQVADLVREEFRLLTHERLKALFVNSGGQLITSLTLAEGSLNQVVIQPREVFYPALRLQAAAVFLAHNHTSGDPTPSAADIQMSRSLQQAGKHLHIPLLDHVIMGHRTVGRSQDFVSLKAVGHLTV